jgi:hypothetical protein
MKESADSAVPSSDLGAFERAASANDSTDTTKKYKYIYKRKRAFKPCPLFRLTHQRWELFGLNQT